MTKHLWQLLALLCISLHLSATHFRLGDHAFLYEDEAHASLPSFEDFYKPCLSNSVTHYGTIVPLLILDEIACLQKPAPVINAIIADINELEKEAPPSRANKTSKRKLKSVTGDRDDN